MIVICNITEVYLGGFRALAPLGSLRGAKKKKKERDEREKRKRKRKGKIKKGRQERKQIDRKVKQAGFSGNKTLWAPS